MYRYKGFCLILILIFFTTACSKNIDTTTSNNNKYNKNDNTEQSYPPSKEETDLSNTLTTDEYKQLLIANYEKYIKPLDLDEYDDLKLVASTKGLTDNESLINEYKIYINDNRSNLMSFEQSMINLNIEKSELKDINDQLIKECKIYIRDLDKIESYLEVIDQDKLTKPNEEFIYYLEDIINKEEIEQSNFENIIVDTQKELDITLKSVEKVQ